MKLNRSLAISNKIIKLVSLPERGGIGPTEWAAMRDRSQFTDDLSIYPLFYSQLTSKEKIAPHLFSPPKK